LNPRNQERRWKIDKAGSGQGGERAFNISK
jgi:hypothetical protein